MSLTNQLKLAFNRLLLPSGFELVRQQKATMERGLRRLPGLGFQFGSIVDIGAASGMWTEMTAPIFPEAKFLMVEALREREPILARKTCQYPERFAYQICAAGSSHGSVSFHVSEDLDGSGVAGSEGTKDPKVREVEMLSVDELVAIHDLKAPHLLKFDTHGFELEILRNATKTLKNTNFIVMECYLFQLSKSSLLFWKMCDYLEQHGFRAFDIVDPLYRPKDGMLWQVDLFFARNEWPNFQDTIYGPR